MIPGDADPATDPYRGRRPTTHERMAGRSWDMSYVDGPAPWDIGRHQPAVVRLASKGGFTGPVLDAGCGTGENALFLASQGLEVVGVDVADTALAMARAKANDRRLGAEFAAIDAFHLSRLDRKFRTVLDCGLFHSLDSDEREAYATSLTSVTGSDALLFLLCFSDVGSDPGPHPVTQQELRAVFTPDRGWEVVAIDADCLETRLREHCLPAWLLRARRVPILPATNGARGT